MKRQTAIAATAATRSGVWRFIEEWTERLSLGKAISIPGIPVGNYIVIILASITFMMQFLYDASGLYLNGLILQHWSLQAIFGHMWLHTGLVHVISNLVILWIFGRHVCLRMGNANYVIAYLLVGFASAVVHVAFDGRPAIGASGATMGILGLHVVFCFNRFGTLGPWIIFIWYMLNLTAGVVGASAATHLAHAGGFCGGLVLAAILILLNIVECEEDPLPAPS